jgi:transposase-like protein
MFDPGNCFICNKPITKCKCEVTETYNTSDGAVCPYCGELNKACDSDSLLYSEDIDSWECDHCGKTFRVDVHISYSWSAKTMFSNPKSLKD